MIENSVVDAEFSNIDRIIFRKVVLAYAYPVL